MSCPGYPSRCACSGCLPWCSRPGCPCLCALARCPGCPSWLARSDFLALFPHVALCTCMLGRAWWCGLPACRGVRLMRTHGIVTGGIPCCGAVADLCRASYTNGSERYRGDRGAWRHSPAARPRLPRAVCTPPPSTRGALPALRPVGAGASWAPPLRHPPGSGGRCGARGCIPLCCNAAVCRSIDGQFLLFTLVII